MFFFHFDNMKKLRYFRDTLFFAWWTKINLSYLSTMPKDLNSIDGMDILLIRPRDSTYPFARKTQHLWLYDNFNSPQKSLIRRRLSFASLPTWWNLYTYVCTYVNIIRNTHIMRGLMIWHVFRVHLGYALEHFVLQKF